MNTDLLWSLKEQSTIRLFFLGLITYHVYLAYYIKRQSMRMNKYANESTVISINFVDIFIALSWASLALFFPYVYFGEDHPVAILSTVVDLVWVICLVVWGFKARDLMNTALMSPKGSYSWFHAVWTLLFTPLYFNLKVNHLCKDIAAPVAIQSYSNQCRQCGADIPDKSNYCPNCGSPRSTYGDLYVKK